MVPFDTPLIVALLPLPITVAVAVIDGRRRIIPNRLNFALLGLGLAVAAGRALDGNSSAVSWAVSSAVVSALAQGLATAGLAFAALWAVRAAHARLRGRVGLGLGDVKFIAAGAAWTGLAGLPAMILAASVLALAVLAVAVLRGRSIDGATRLPFGPFLAVGLHAALLMQAFEALP
ncbi:prepilin peptidase [Methylobacterium sp. Leaf112]|uniref:prepilin peptidase n=1 Tax=Methylobacterium sp. Leaf112 TaxID=1736258 RepID=UPI0006F1F61B|nr:A24 family peptidase [Methylobacterium sp. Leaf112]KQP66128.1 peptidase A24 [Methylobacterium sp. Leaf112]